MKDFENLTGIKVEYTTTPEENYFDKLNTALSSRSGTPDVFMTGAYQVWEYAPAGYMQALEDYISDPSKTDPNYNFADFYPAVAGALQWDLKAGDKVGSGSQWALPMGYELNTLCYNQKALKEDQVKEIATTDGLAKVAKSLKGWNGANSYGIAVRGTRNWATIHPGYMSLFGTWGAQDFAIEGGKLVSKLDSAEAVAMTDYWVNLVKDAGPSQWSTYTWYEASSDLGAGQAAILFDATTAAYFQNFAGASNESGNLAWTGIPLPAGKTKMESNVWVWSLAMNADSKNKDAAWYYIQYFTGPEFTKWAATEGSCVDCARKSIATGSEYAAYVGDDKAKNYTAVFAELIDNATILFTPQPYFFECTTNWAATLQDLVTSNTYSSTEEAMKKLTAAENEIVADLEVG